MMTVNVALLGAGGKMGSRITDNMKDLPEYNMLYVEVSPQGIANLAQRGVSPTPQADALEQADAVILALPDRLIGKVTHEVIPLREDLTYFISHPCHPPLFNDEVTPEGRTDWFGGVHAKQHIVCALHYGDEAQYAKGEAIARAMYAPVMNAYRITTEHMAILEPALVETFCATLGVAMKEALDKAVEMGVPEEAAREFLFGHIRIEMAIIFGFAGFPFSDGAKLAIQQAYDKIFKPDWKENIMNLGALKQSVAAITDSLK
jgi:hypothetical protein